MSYVASIRRPTGSHRIESTVEDVALERVVLWSLEAIALLG